VREIREPGGALAGTPGGALAGTPGGALAGTPGGALAGTPTLTLQASWYRDVDHKQGQKGR
jgi:hypothetical protein